MVWAPVHPLASSLSRPINALVSTLEVGIGEMDYWVHRIVSRLGRPVDVRVVDLGNLQIVDDSIVVGMSYIDQWMDAIVQSGFHNIGLLRIGKWYICYTCHAPPFSMDSIAGDEKGLDNNYEPFAYVLRPYWFESIYPSTNDTPVLWIPNGYSRGVGPRLSSTLLPFSHRPTLCYFEGSLRDNGDPSSREKMRLALLEWDPNHEICDIQWTNGFMGGDAPLAYSASLARTKYALCPGGENAETIWYAPRPCGRVFVFVLPKCIISASTRFGSSVRIHDEFTQ